jgi:hypothetical protein
VTSSRVWSRPCSKPCTVAGLPVFPFGTSSTIVGAPMNRYETPSMRAMPPMAVTWPVQNCCQVPGSVVAGSQVLRYGLRTASGAAGGRIGVAAGPPGTGADAADAAVSCASAGPPGPAGTRAGRWLLAGDLTAALVAAPATPPAAATAPE